MIPVPVKTFVHPAKAYRLEYPSHWDQVTQDEGRSCGFGPHDRDDVGLWISIMPLSVDTERFSEDLPKIMEGALPKFEAENLRLDPSLRHHALKADIRKEGQGGNYWLVAGGDLILFVSTQVPYGERDQWNPAFEKLMASLQITRDRELHYRKVADEVLAELRKRRPDQDFEFDEQGIRGKNQVVYLSSLYREVKQSPERQAEIIRNFVDNLSQPMDPTMGYEAWADVRPHILPVLKPRDYIRSDSPTQHLQITEWLADVVICYVIHRPRMFRFVTGWDVQRWETDPRSLHELALANLAGLPWPRRLEGARQPDGGRVMLVETNDSMTASRLLHPELHHLFSQALGSPFWAGIPDARPFFRPPLSQETHRPPAEKRLRHLVLPDHAPSLPGDARRHRSEPGSLAPFNR